MSHKEIRNITVIGAGILGHGIAQTFAAAGYQVVLNDICTTRIKEAKQNIVKNIELLRENNICKDPINDVLNRIKFTTDIKVAVSDSDLVIEAVPEDLSLKKDVFKMLDSYCPEHSILASNSSSLVPSDYAGVTSREEKVLGMHFFNPPYLLPLVEIVKGPKTSNETINQIVALLTRMKMKPIVINKESAGFIGNRLQFALLNEAIRIVEEKIAEPEDIDQVVKYGFGRRLGVLGPFEVFDLGGWDTISKVQPNITGKKVSSLIQDKVNKGQFGVKSGKGFYDWDAKKINHLKKKITETLINIEKISHKDLTHETT